MDGNINNMFHAAGFESIPFFEIEFLGQECIKSFDINIRSNCCGDMFRDIVVTVGNVPTTAAGKLSDSPLCTRFQGPSVTGAKETLTCDRPMCGKFLTLQKDDSTYFHFAEIGNFILGGE